MSASQAPIGNRAGEYEITGVLGRGGMGTVFAGVHPIIGTEVAIKVIDPVLARDSTLVARFIQEARAVNKIRHPNIIDIFAFGEAPDIGHYFVMPLLHGCSVEAKVKDEGPMSLAQALPIVEQIADALDAVHAQGILHRDLKPENIFLEDGPHGESLVRILDFGLAKLTDSDAVATTAGRQQFGTPLFMSPEQWDGAGVDHRSDIYALGIVIYFMLTGRCPFESSSPLELMSLHVTADPDPPSRHGAVPLVDEVLLKALAKKKDERYSAAGELCDALFAAVSGDSETRIALSSRPSGRMAAAFAPTVHTPVSVGVAADSGPVGEPVGRSARRWPWAAGLAALALAGAVVWVAGRGGQARAPAQDPGSPDGGRALAVAADAAAPPFVPDSATGDPVTAKVHVVLRSEPSPALVRLDGKIIGETPLEMDLAKAELGRFTFEREGYASRVIEVPLSRDVSEVVELARRKVRPGAQIPEDKEPSKWGETVDPY